MVYTKQYITDYIDQEDVKFIRLAFCDVFGTQKNVSIMPSKLTQAFERGIAFNPSEINGFESHKSDLFLFPDPSTLNVLPWRPSHGRVVRLFCNIKQPDQSPIAEDCRYILQQAVEAAKSRGITCDFGAEFEFYLFQTDENGNATSIPGDNAGYLDIAPEDKGENTRREICLTLEEMGMRPESSHHEKGPGQHEINFLQSDALSAADNATTFKVVVKTIAARNGFAASFMPKPIRGKSGNGMHINMYIKSQDGQDYTSAFAAGILAHIRDITIFLNPLEDSYERLGQMSAPRYVTWSAENRSQLLRIPISNEPDQRIELRSADPMANPYLAYALLIYAGLDGIQKSMTPAQPVNADLNEAEKSVANEFKTLPHTLSEATHLAKNSSFVSEVLPKHIIDVYCNRAFVTI